MIEILVGAGLVLAGAAAARVLLRTRETSTVVPSEPDGRAPIAAGPRGLLVGDVLLLDDTELWLAGMVELDEEGFVARLFPSPGGVHADWVAQLDENANDLAALRATLEVPEGAVPESLPIEGRRLTLERRGHAMIRTGGEHLPRTNKKGAYHLLSDAGGRVLVVVDFDQAPRIALHGERLERHRVDLLPGGDLPET